MSHNYQEFFAKADRLRNGGQTDEAVAVYADIATLATEEGETALAARALHGAGNCLKMTIGQGQGSNFQKTIDFFGRALAKYQELSDARGQGAVLRDLGVAADKFGSTSLALESFQKSIEFLSQVEEPAELGITYDKLGLHFTRLGQTDAALPYMNKSLELLRQEPTQGFFRATTLLDRARTYYAQKDFEHALQDALEAKGWFEADHGGDTFEHRQIQVSGLLSLVYDRLGSPKQATAHLGAYNRLIRHVDPAVAATLKGDFEALAQLH